MPVRFSIPLALLGPLVLMGAVSAEPPAPGTWTRRTPLPDPHGFAGMFAGVSGGRLIAAGGANFPNGSLWEGGKKTWSDAIYVLDAPDGAWRKVAGRLPRAMGYGVFASHGDRVIVAGGESPATDGTGTTPRREVVAMRWTGDDVSLEELPPLPQPMMSGCGAVLGSTLYVAGGAASPTESLRTFWSLDLSAGAQARWVELEPWDGPSRILAVAVAHEGRVYLLSGAELSEGPDGQPARRYLRDAHCYTPGSGWRRIAELPRAAVAAPSPAPVASGRLLVLGGDAALELHLPQAERTGFPADVLAYDAADDRWETAGAVPASRVTVPTVLWRDEWYVVSGEQRPGIRSPEVWSFRPTVPP